jgi:hypothetical protein
MRVNIDNNTVDNRIIWFKGTGDVFSPLYNK